MERGVYDTNNQPEMAAFKYKQEGLFCIHVSKVENKEYGKITGKRCLLFNHTEYKIAAIDALKR